MFLVLSLILLLTVSLTKTSKKGLESKQNLIEEVSVTLHRSFGGHMYLTAALELISIKPLDHVLQHDLRSSRCSLQHLNISSVLVLGTYRI